jgi:branched-chain amino acid transport system ATP-binding protein
VFPNLSVAENLQVATQRLPQEAAHAPTIELFPELAALQQRRAGLLSGGERQALALAMVFSRRPKLLLLDEPTAGLAPVVAVRLLSTTTRFARESGTAVLLVEHMLAMASASADRVYALRGGAVVEEHEPRGRPLPADLVERVFFG